MVSLLMVFAGSSVMSMDDFGVVDSNFMIDTNCQTPKQSFYYRNAVSSPKSVVEYGPVILNGKEIKFTEVGLQPVVQATQISGPRKSGKKVFFHPDTIFVERQSTNKAPWLLEKLGSVVAWFVQEEK